MICKNCNKNIDEDSKFCQLCGSKVEKVKDSKAEDIEKQLIDHLEFLGYEVEKLDLVGNAQQYVAKHKSRPNLVFNPITNIGISFVSFYMLDKDKIEKDKKGILEIINRMNNQALFCSFSISPNSENFVCSALYFGKYSKKDFADFIDLFEEDIQSRIRAESALADFS